MMNTRLLSFFAILLGISSSVPSIAQTNRQENKAKQHFERGFDLAIVDDPRAEREYRLAIKCNEGFYPEAWRELAGLFQRKARLSEAVEALEQYIAQTPQEDHGYDYQNLADLNRTIALKTRIDNSDVPSLNDLLEFTMIGYGEIKHIIPYAEKAVRLYPDSSKAYLRLAALLPNDQKERRFNLIKRSVELDPADPKAHTTLGGYYFIPLGNLPEAIKEFRTALEVSNGQYEYAWEGLGRVLAINGKKKEAIEAFQNYLRVRKEPSQNDGEIERMIEELEGVP